ncbi:hypothetical protein [Bacillus sp. V3-13]|nr:hypothetical protein [Bacillus sp. V3-13]
MKAQQTVYVNEFTNGILDPEQEMLGPVKVGLTDLVKAQYSQSLE